MPSNDQCKEAKECTQTIECESTSVHSYLNLLQTVINRMASNSASCKSWCITLVSAIIVILIDKNKGQYILIAIAPTVLFLILDSYYLAMEKSFRDIYNTFIKKLHGGLVEKKDLFVISPESAVTAIEIGKSIKSFSVYPFYLVLLVMICLISLITSNKALSWILNVIK